MSCEGTMIGSPFAGERMLFEASISVLASICASSDSGMCTAIWSPSKSALNAAHTSGCSWIALPSISTGSKAWMPSLCSVGARLSSTGCSRITSSRMSHTSGRSFSTMRLAALIALQHVAERLKRALVGAGDDAAAAAVVEQRIDRLLQHALLVAHDDVGRAQLDQPLQAVVAVDDAAVEIVEVGGREAAAVEGHQRAQLRRDHRHHLEDHPLRPARRLDEGLHQLQALHELLA